MLYPLYTEGIFHLRDLLFATMLLHASYPLVGYESYLYSEKGGFSPLLHPEDHPGAGPKPQNFEIFHIYFTSACIHNFSKNTEN